MSNVCIIPARGGSKRIPRKNIKLFHGKPIIAYSIETAKETIGGFTRRPLFDRIVVSTEDEEIAGIAHEYGAEVLRRPVELTKDDVGTHEVTKHACETLGLYDWFTVCCLYATAPLLRPMDLTNGDLAFWYRRPMFLMAVGTEPLRDAGLFYFGYAHSFKNFKLFESWGRTGGTDILCMPEERVCDINTPKDWSNAEQMYAKMYRSS